jgi:hypothetical protein
MYPEVSVGTPCFLCDDARRHEPGGAVGEGEREDGHKLLALLIGHGQQELALALSLELTAQTHHAYATHDARRTHVSSEQPGRQASVLMKTLKAYTRSWRSSSFSSMATP